MARKNRQHKKITRAIYRNKTAQLDQTTLRGSLLKRIVNLLAGTSLTPHSKTPR